MLPLQQQQQQQQQQQTQGGGREAASFEEHPPSMGRVSDQPDSPSPTAPWVLSPPKRLALHVFDHGVASRFLVYTPKTLCASRDYFGV
jgi:hypothetical protein